MWSNFATEFAYNIITNLRMSWSGLSCHQGYLLLRISTMPQRVSSVAECGDDLSRVWLWHLIVKNYSESDHKHREQQLTVSHLSQWAIYGGQTAALLQLRIKSSVAYIYDLYVVFLPPYSIFTQRFREYWNYGNGIKMCTGGTSYILQECSYKDIIQLQDLHNIIIFDLSIENCSGVKNPFWI